MRITTNEQIIKAFIEGATAGKVNNLEIVGGKLVNYGTVIAERVHGWNGHSEKIIVNSTKYSVTTSKIQSKLRSLIPANMMLVTMAHVPMGTQSMSGLITFNPVTPS